MGILTDLFLTFARIGAFTFGGGYAMLSLLEHECVEKKGWLTTDEMTEVTVNTGLKQAGLKGALTATLGMVLPSFLVLLAVSAFLQNVLTVPLVTRALKGIRVAAVLLILRAGTGMLRNILKKTPDRKAAVWFFALFLAVSLVSLLLSWHIPAVCLILAAGLAGYALFSVREAAK